ncbi:hypothetical protein PUT90_28515, partial [Klebsiella pneumoniae]|uniref:hypothetical protein n=1 Tax=Klebsiella pneumoniae TaxID=573 RepID=UPI002366532D
FNWDGHDAAYFLLAEDGRVTLLVALTLETPPRLVVCNISSPNDRSQNIRVLLPLLLGSLRINGITMSIAAV